MYCKYCGSQIPDDSVYCIKCGKQINDHVEKEKGLTKAAKAVIVAGSIFIIILVIAAAFIFLKPEKNTGEPDESANNIVQTEEKTEEIKDDTKDIYIFEESNSRFLTWDDVKGMNAEMLRIARNEIFARHGRKFNDKELQEYFNKQSWYKGTVNANEFNNSVLNKYEKQNIDFLQKAGNEKQIDELPYAPSVGILKKYAEYGSEELSYWKDDISDIADLGIWTTGKIIEETNLYYIVEAGICVPISIEEELSVGDIVQVTVNEITGETETWECYDKDEYAIFFVNEDGESFYQNYPYSKDIYYDGMSDDKVYKDVHEGKVAVLKSAKDEIGIMGEEMKVSKETFEDGFWNYVIFNEKGYIERLIYLGD